MNKNNIVNMIITECGKGECTCDTGAIKKSFQDTLNGLNKAQFTYTIDSVPIFTFKADGVDGRNFDSDDAAAGVGGNPGYGMDDHNPDLLDSEGTKKGKDLYAEQYIVDYEMLCNLVESYDNIDNILDAHVALCNHNRIAKQQLCVAFENAKAINEAMERFSRTGGDFGFFENYNAAINALIEEGITCYTKK